MPSQNHRLEVGLDSCHGMECFLDDSSIPIYLDLKSLLSYFDDNSGISFIGSDSTREKTNPIANLEKTTRSKHDS